MYDSQNTFKKNVALNTKGLSTETLGMRLNL